MDSLWSSRVPVLWALGADYIAPSGRRFTITRRPHLLYNRPSLPDEKEGNTPMTTRHGFTLLDERDIPEINSGARRSPP